MCQQDFSEDYRRTPQIFSGQNTRRCCNSRENDGEVRLYLIVGGMPAAVMRYLETNNLQEVLRIQRSIITLYKRDIARYDPEEKLYLEDIFDL